MFIKIMQDITMALGFILMVALAFFFLKMKFWANDNLEKWRSKLSQNPLPKLGDQQIHITLLKPTTAYMKSDYLNSFMSVIAANKRDPKVNKIVSKKELKNILFYNKFFLVIILLLFVDFILMYLFHVNT